MPKKKERKRGIAAMVKAGKERQIREVMPDLLPETIAAMTTQQVTDLAKALPIKKKRRGGF
jgi:hypothetical protein